MRILEITECLFEWKQGSEKENKIISAIYHVVEKTDGKIGIESDQIMGGGSPKEKVIGKVTLKR